ncbi:MAG TPA: amidohydrolase family protein, partial [Calditrichia bacterium]|nr:amidohydrolase family protein [Calditrichia bacterium]
LRLMALTQKERTSMGEAMPIAQALAIATHGSAQVYGQPNDLGAVEAGYLADLILIDRDIFAQPAEALLETRVQLTLQNGNIVHEDM